MDSPLPAPLAPPGEGLDVIRSLKDIAFGSAAGMVAKVFEHPFDLCKVRLQSQVLHETARFNGPIDCLYKTWKYEGIRGLYRGLPPPVLGAAAENATLFLTYNNLRRLLAAYNPSAVERARGTPLEHTLIAAAGAGAVTSFVLTPIELIKCKMQVQMIAASPFPGSPSAAIPIKPSDLPGPIAILRSVVKAEGLRGLWLGHTGTLIRESGGGVAWFGIKEVVSGMLLDRHPAASVSPSETSLSITPGDSNSPPPSLTSIREKELLPWESAFAGACAGVGYTMLLFPADCVKSTIQTEEELRPRAVGSTEPRSTFTGVFKEIYKAKGLKGLYAGAGVTAFRSALSSGLMFLIYDALEKHLG